MQAQQGKLCLSIRCSEKTEEAKRRHPVLTSLLYCTTQYQTILYYTLQYCKKSNLQKVTLFEVVIYHCFILGAEHVSVHRGAEPANSEGFPICHEDGKPDEGPEDQVQTD